MTRAFGRITGAVALALVQASCALVFTDYPSEDGGVGAEGGATTQAGGGAGGQGGSGGEGGDGGSGGDSQECTRTVLAIDRLLFDTDLAGTYLQWAWKAYGADIDGQVTGGDFSMHCAVNSGANPYEAFADGDDGIDNSFGRNFVPSLGTMFSPDIAASITSGNVGYFFDLVDLTPAPDQADITTRFYSGAPLVTAPVFDGTQCWDVDGASVTDRDDIGTAQIAFTGGLLTNDRWDSGLPRTLVLPLKYQGILFPLTIHRAKIEVQLARSHDGSEPGEFGIISGILDTEEFVEALSRYIRASMPDECANALPHFATIARRASDILIDGTQDPKAVCNGISVGVGFTAKPILLGSVGPASSAPTVPCPPVE